MKGKLSLTCWYCTILKFNKGKSCPCGWTNPDTNTCWGQWAGKQLHIEGSGGHMLNKKLSTHQQLTCTARTATDILSCIRKNSSSSWRKTTLSLCSALVELRYIWSVGSRSELLKHKIHLDIPDYIQQRVTEKWGWKICHMMRHWESWEYLVWRKKALEGSYWFLEILGGKKVYGLKLFLVTGQEAMSTK